MSHGLPGRAGRVRAGVLGRARSLRLRTLPASLARTRPSHPASACPFRNEF